ncbi:hypothetical protein [Bradyrhizobium embrapense]|uniref:hypothetical protein n=1 Tax=Bradyrhizobium embrapense TaxID=630921 RepID=UPI0032214774
MPAGPVDAWTSPPFDPNIRGGRIYARGAGDNKGKHSRSSSQLTPTLRCMEDSRATLSSC